MPGPFIFIATNKLKQGKIKDEKRRVPELSDFIEANEPRLIAFNEYADENGSEVAVVQVHPDAESMEFHMEVVRERAARLHAETLEATTGIEVFGSFERRRSFDAASAGRGRHSSESKANHLGGFMRATT